MSNRSREDAAEHERFLRQTMKKMANFIQAGSDILFGPLVGGAQGAVVGLAATILGSVQISFPISAVQSMLTYGGLGSAAGMLNMVLGAMDLVVVHMLPKAIRKNDLLESMFRLSNLNFAMFMAFAGAYSAPLNKAPTGALVGGALGMSVRVLTNMLISKAI